MCGSGPQSLLPWTYTASSLPFKISGVVAETIFLVKPEPGKIIYQNWNLFQICSGAGARLDWFQFRCGLRIPVQNSTTLLLICFKLVKTVLNLFESHYDSFKLAYGYSNGYNFLELSRLCKLN